MTVNSTVLLDRHTRYSYTNTSIMSLSGTCTPWGTLPQGGCWVKQRALCERGCWPSAVAYATGVGGATPLVLVVWIVAPLSATDAHEKV